MRQQASLVFDFFRLFRPANLGILGLSAGLLPYCFGQGCLLPWSFYGALLATAAAGYALNDYADLEIDRWNKPQRPLLRQETLKTNFWPIYALSQVLALILAYTHSWSLLAVSGLTALLLVWYAYWGKRSGLPGNILVAGLCTWPLYLAWHYAPCPLQAEGEGYLLFYLVWAFGASLWREIVKDAEDVEGDARAGSQSLALRWAWPKLCRGLQAWGLGLGLFSLVYAYGYLQLSAWAWLGLGLFVLAPLPFLLLWQGRMQKSEDAAQLSRVLKYYMLWAWLWPFWGYIAKQAL